jgi:hypothetical protein
VLRAEGIESVQRLLEARDGTAEPPELAALLRARFLNIHPIPRTRRPCWLRYCRPDNAG